MRVSLFKSAIAVGLFALAPQALAVSFVAPDKSVTLDANDPFAFTAFYNGFNTSAQTSLPGLSAKIRFNFLGTSNSNKTYNFSYSVTNTSASPVTASRVSVVAFDTDPNIVNASASGMTASGTFATVGRNANIPNVGTREVCLKGGGGVNSCAGGGGTGVLKGQTDTGLFSLNFALGQSIIKLQNFAIRYQSVQGDQNTPNSASGKAETVIVSAVPEPASWAMMITGFGFAGAAMRRRRLVRSAA